jgi:hypothetical protein
MTTTRKTILSLALTLTALLALTITASAASYWDGISGAELPNATSTEGRFVGTAWGDLPGGWYIDVKHDVLPGNNTSVFINGGSFKLDTVISWRPVTVYGYFPWHGGMVTQTDGFIGCGNQHFSVSGRIAGVQGGSGYGYFSAKLTHYRHWVWWLGCVIYSASVSGSVSLTF